MARAKSLGWAGHSTAHKGSVLRMVLLPPGHDPLMDTLPGHWLSLRLRVVTGTRTGFPDSRQLYRLRRAGGGPHVQLQHLPVPAGQGALTLALQGVPKAIGGVLPGDRASSLRHPGALPGGNGEGGWATQAGSGPSRRNSSASHSDPGPEPTTLDLELGEPACPLGSQGIRRQQVVQVSVV